MSGTNFSEEISSSLRIGVPRASALIAFAFIVFIFVDISFAPSDITPFIRFRLIIVTVALSILFTSLTSWGKKTQIIHLLGYAAMTNCAIGVSWLTHMTGGTSSMYWTMLMLTFFGGTMLLRLSLLEALFLYGSHIVLYTALMLYRGEVVFTPSFMASIGGLLVAFVVSITGHAYIRLLMKNEFNARQSLAEANEQLTKSVTELEYKQQQAELRHLQSKLEFANDLHDVVGAKLSQVVVIANATRIEDTTYLRALADSILENVRNFAQILKGEENAAGLNIQLSRITHSLRALGRYKVEYVAPQEEIPLSDLVLLNIDRIFSEWTANAIRHAHASAFSLGVRSRQKRLLVWFYQNATPFTWRGKAERGGLKSIAMRAQNIGARVSVRRYKGGAIFFLRMAI